VEQSSEYIVIAEALLTENGFITDRTVRIKDGFISDITSHAQASHNVKVFEFSGHLIAPCFCDYHLHFFKRKKEKIKEITDALTSCGISKVYEGGDSYGYGMEVKKSVTDRLTVQSAGYALYKKASYGSYIGRGVENRQEAENIIDRLSRDGVDYIKVVHSGVFQPADGTISSGGFAFQELKHLITYAGARGLDVVCHANGDEAVREAIEAGVSYIVHGLGISSESIALMAEKKISFIPTVNAFACLASPGLQKEANKNIRGALAKHLIAIKRASDMGVKVLPGSDAGPAAIPYGVSYLKELRLFQDAGISPEKILISAAAGKLEQGAKADFLILNGFTAKHVCRGGYLSTPQTGT